MDTGFFAVIRAPLMALSLAMSFALASPAMAQTCAGDVNADGKVDGGDLAVVLANWGTCPAAIQSVSPMQGSVLGGTVITITGTGLTTTSGVAIGGVPCTAVQVLSPTQVRATTPAGSAGPASIAVTTVAGTSLAPTPFIYVQQSVASIVPNTGAYIGGTAITITGSFLAGTTSVTIGGVPATDVQVVDATTVTATTPAGSVGAVDVVVSGAKGTVTVAAGFTYLGFVVPSWATLLEAFPDPAVVWDANLRAAITATGLAWRVKDTATQIEMVLIPPGSFQMGCIMRSNQYECYPVELPVHQVTLTNAFYIGRYEVTQSQWVAKMGSNPSFFQGQPDSASRPVERVSWNTIQGYLGSTGLRLPTEAEWEYACRAGTLTPFYNGSTDDSTVGALAWYSLNANSRTHAVGGKQANGFGLYDMLGNVFEWVNDGYDAYPSSAQTNPTGPVSSSFRMVRGGSWYPGPQSVRSSNRSQTTPNSAGNELGFRVARNP